MSFLLLSQQQLESNIHETFDQMSSSQMLSTAVYGLCALQWCFSAVKTYISSMLPVSPILISFVAHLMLSANCLCQVLARVIRHNKAGGLEADASVPPSCE